MLDVVKRAWLFLTASDEHRSWAANHGYDDLVGLYYSYDSNVTYHQMIGEGDLVVVRVDEYVAGWSVIDEIARSPNISKDILRCPTCGTTKFYARAEKRPTYRCSECKDAFDIPAVTQSTVNGYQARYEKRWVEAVRPVHFRKLKEFVSSSNDRSAIRPLDITRVPELLDLISATDKIAQPDVVLGDSVVTLTGYAPHLGRRRIGQQQFRLSMIDRFGENCAMTGSQPPQVLEASHVRRFSEFQQHDRSNGLLLRRDLHALFDAHLVTINPKRWCIEVAPQVLRYQEYSKLQGSPLMIPESARPKNAYVEEHFEVSRQRFVA